MDNQPNPLPLLKTEAPVEQADVVEAVRKAGEENTPVYPIGGGVSLGYGAFPTQPGVGLSLAHLGESSTIPHNLTITVEAGMTLRALQEHLAAEGQQLPINAPQPDRATVGGVIATAYAGPRQYRWGSIRDYVVGFRAVDGTGQSFANGGRVVKNAAGIDLCRLMAGSLGTLGVITQATLMVKPIPETSAFVVCHLASLETAEPLLASLVKSPITPSAIEVAFGTAWKDSAQLGPQTGDAAAQLIVGVEGSAAEVDWMIQQLESEWRLCSVSPSVVLRGEEAPRFLEHLREFPWTGSVRENASQLTLQINTLPSRVVHAIRAVRQRDPEASILAHAGVGSIAALVSTEEEQPTPWIEGLRQQISELGGNLIVAASSPAAAIPAAVVWGERNGVMPLLQAIKDQFDPKGILNRDRFLFSTTSR